MVLAVAAAIMLTSGGAAAPVRSGPDVRISDVHRFFRLYDEAGGRPEGDRLQRDYIEAGSPGVREFLPSRIISGERLAARIREQPQPYAQARSCLPVLTRVKTRLVTALRKLTRLLPEARLPPVTVLIGRNNSAGTTGAGGVLVGLEVACATVAAGDSAEDHFVHLIAHEYAHVQQPEAPEDETVLRGALREGAAELVAELITGRIASLHLQRWIKGREAEVGEQFLSAADGHDLRAWLMYTGSNPAARPGDAGYWVGWRIARRFHARAPDKRAALRELLLLRDPKSILMRSGWRPGD